MHFLKSTLFCMGNALIYIIKFDTKGFTVHFLLRFWAKVYCKNVQTILVKTLTRQYAYLTSSSRALFWKLV